MSINMSPYQFTRRSDQATGIAGIPNPQDFNYDSYLINMLINSQLSSPMINFMLFLRDTIHIPNNWKKRTESLIPVISDLDTHKPTFLRAPTSATDALSCYLGGMLTRGSVRKGRRTKDDPTNDFRTTLFDVNGNLENPSIIDWLSPIIHKIPENAYAAVEIEHILPSAVLRWPTYSVLLDVVNKTNTTYTYEIGSPKKWVIEELLSLGLAIPLKGQKQDKEQKAVGRPRNTLMATSWGERLIDLAKRDERFIVTDFIRQAARTTISRTPTSTNSAFTNIPTQYFPSHLDLATGE